MAPKLSVILLMQQMFVSEQFPVWCTNSFYFKSSIISVPPYLGWDLSKTNTIVELNQQQPREGGGGGGVG